MCIRDREVFRLLGLWGPSLVTPMLQLNAQKKDVPGTLACLEEFLAALQQPGQSNATPVSYTHLDVYKRQVRVNPAQKKKSRGHAVPPENGIRPLFRHSKCA